MKSAVLTKKFSNYVSPTKIGKTDVVYTERSVTPLATISMLGFTTTHDARELSDEEVLARATSEPWLFAVILERYQEAFLRRARHILRSELDAEDVVQETFTKIYVNAAKFEVREGAKFSSWAYMILTNTSLTRYAKNAREGKTTSPLDPEFEQSFADLSTSKEDQENRDMIERVLSGLPEHFSAVLRLFYLERWSHKDIAKKTGESVSAVKTRVHRAKQAFRAKLGEMGM